jgi:hypothetical protein
LPFALRCALGRCRCYHHQHHRWHLEHVSHARWSSAVAVAPDPGPAAPDESAVTCPRDPSALAAAVETASAQAVARGQDAGLGGLLSRVFFPTHRGGKRPSEGTTACLPFLGHKMGVGGPPPPKKVYEKKREKNRKNRAIFAWQILTPPHLTNHHRHAKGTKRRTQV